RHQTLSLSKQIGLYCSNFSFCFAEITAFEYSFKIYKDGRRSAGPKRLASFVQSRL
ncbi:hypothetical protein CUMW_008840, partial [Citrus unshiu]